MFVRLCAAHKLRADQELNCELSCSARQARRPHHPVDHFLVKLVRRSRPQDGFVRRSKCRSLRNSAGPASVLAELSPACHSSAPSLRHPVSRDVSSAAAALEARRGDKPLSSCERTARNGAQECRAEPTRARSRFGCFFLIGRSLVAGPRAHSTLGRARRLR
jgi:hypothetical protein